MNLRHVLLAVPLALVAACSSDTETFTLSTGTYAVSGATIGTATPGDECDLLPTYTAADKVIGIAVSGSTATFDLAFGGAAITQPSATVNGNSIESPVEANYTANLGNCVLRIRRTVVGELTGNDAAALQLHANISVDTSGTDCDGTPYVMAGGCESDIHFLANKVLQ